MCRSKTSSGSRSYKGIGDDQLEGEEDRDDHLLPMWSLLIDRSQRWMPPHSFQMFHAFQSGFSYLNFFMLKRKGYIHFVLNLSSGLLYFLQFFDSTHWHYFNTITHVYKWLSGLPTLFHKPNKFSHLRVILKSRLFSSLSFLKHNWTLVKWYLVLAINWYLIFFREAPTHCRAELILFEPFFMN